MPKPLIKKVPKLPDPCIYNVYWCDNEFEEWMVYEQFTCHACFYTYISAIFYKYKLYVHKRI